MICAWQELLSVLPGWVAEQVDKAGKENGQELRLRLGAQPELVCWPDSIWLKGTVGKDDLNFCINTASKYSPWSAQSTAYGYLTAPGGHRIGICGDAVIKDEQMSGIRRVTSLCIRIARDFPDIAKDTAKREGSILVIGPPGSGKTTLLRDLVRQISQKEFVSVVDERGELFPEHFTYGKRLDVLKGCPKKDGIDVVLRSMGPQCIAVDEITAAEDCDALLRAGWCGVRLLATAHAGSRRDLESRPLYRPILENGIFDHILILNREKKVREERMGPC